MTGKTGINVDKSDIVWRLIYQCNSSCSCLTKTPEPEYHELNCRYRVLMDAITEIQELRNPINATI
jgi:hypothetical protein